MANKRTVREFVLAMRDEGVTQTNAGVNKLLGTTGKLPTAYGHALRAGKLAFLGIAAAAGTAAAAVGTAGHLVIGTGSQLEMLKTQLATVLKSEERAEQKLRFIRQLAAETPYEVADLTEASLRLEQFKLSAEDTLTTIGDTAAALGKPIMQAAEAMADLTSGELERLKEFGITSAKIQEELGHEVRRKTVKDLQDNVDAVLRIMRRDYAGGMKNLATTWTGTLSMFADAWFGLKGDIAAGGVFDIVKGDLQAILKLVQRFQTEGGVTAISVGFNEAFKSIHETFFDPLFSNLDEVEIRAELLSLHVERNFLAVALALNDIYVQMARYKDFGIDLQGTVPGVAETRQFFETFREAAEAEGLGEALKVIARGSAEAAEEMAKTASGVRLGQLMWEHLGVALEGAGDHTVKMRERVAELNAQIADFDPDRVTPFDLARDAEEAANQAARAATEYERLWKVMGEKHEPLRGPEAAGREEVFGPPSEEYLQMQLDRKQAHMDEMAAMDLDYYTFTDEMALASSEFYVSTLEWGAMQTRKIYDQLGRYQLIFTKRGMNLGRAMNAFLIRGAGEVAKAGIAALTRKAKIEAASYAADALALAAQGNFAGAAAMAGAAVKKGAIVGLGAIASGLIDRYVQGREQALTERIDTEPALGGGGGAGTSRGGYKQGVARTVRTGPQVIHYYITITNNVAGDYNVSEGDQTDAEQIQELLDSGAVVAPAPA